MSLKFSTSVSLGLHRVVFSPVEGNFHLPVYTHKFDSCAFSLYSERKSGQINIKCISGQHKSSHQLKGLAGKFNYNYPVYPQKVFK